MKYLFYVSIISIGRLDNALTINQSEGGSLMLKHFNGHYPSCKGESWGEKTAFDKHNKW